MNMNQTYNKYHLLRLAHACIVIQRAIRKYLQKIYKKNVVGYLIKTLKQKDIKKRLRNDNSLSTLIENSKPQFEDKRKINKLFQIVQNNRVRLIDSSGYKFTKQDILKKDRKGYTPLHYAAQNNSMPMCRRLFQAGASPNSRSYAGITPTHLVFKTHNLPLMQMFIEVGGDLDIVDNEQKTPLAYGRMGSSSVLTSNMMVSKKARSYSQTNMKELKKTNLVQKVSPRFPDYLEFPKRIRSYLL